MTIDKYKSNRNIVYSCKYHVVWCSKYRRKVLTKDVRRDLSKIIKDVCKEKLCEIFAQEIVVDHVHLLIEVDPQYGVHKLIKQIKGRSANFLRKKYKHTRTMLPSLWTNSYFVSTVGGAPLSIVKQYVENQNVV
jgi:putative transposase